MHALIISFLCSSIGNVLCSVENPAKVTSSVEARIIVFNIDIPITNGYPVSLLYINGVLVKLFWKKY